MDISYDYVNEALQSSGVDASEAHGIVCGMLCHRLRPGSEQWDQGVVNTLSDESSADVLNGMLYNAALKALESAGLEFNLLIPDDDPLAVRARGLSSWCGGFISGFAYGVRQDTQVGESGDEIKEALQDFESIARVRETVEDSEENESDFMQLEEYVRMAVIMIFTELNRGQ